MPPDADDKTHDSHPLNPRETRHALLIAAIAWGVFGSAWMTMVGGAPYVTFVRHKLHVSMAMFGLLSALPQLLAGLQLWGALLVERTRRRKRLFLVCGTANRATWFLIAALPWAIPETYPGARVWAFMGLILIGAVLNHLATPAWFSWFGDMVPEHIRARYLSKRAALSTVTVIIVGAIVPVIVDWNSSQLTFSLIFGVAAGFGVTDILLFRSVREPEMPPHEGPPWTIRAVLEEPLKNSAFRRYLLYTFSELFMFGLSGPFFMVIALEYLKIGNFQSNLFASLLFMVFTAVSLPWWGRVCDTFGAKPLAKLGTIGTLIFPLCWLFATPHHYLGYLVTAAVIGGVFGAAIQTADLSMMYLYTPRERRSAYMACLMLANSLGWGLAPYLSGQAVDLLEGVTWQVGGYTFIGLHFLLMATLVARVVHILFVIPRVSEPGARRTRELARHLVLAPWQRLNDGFTRVAGTRSR